MVPSGGMSPETYDWLRALHVFAVLAWTGTLGAGLHSLLVHSTADPAGRAGLETLERRVGLAMNASGAVAAALGVALLLAPQGWAHLSAGAHMVVKLVAVAALIGVHGYAQVRIRRFRAGAVGPFPPWVIALAYALMFVIVVAVVAEPGSRSRPPQGAGSPEVRR